MTDSDEFVVFELTEANRRFQSFTGVEVARRRAITAAVRCNDFGIEHWRRHAVRIHAEDLGNEWIHAAAEAEALVRAVVWRAQPLGLRSIHRYRWLTRSWNLYKRFRQTWRRVPRGPLKRMLRSVRMSKGRTAKALRKTRRRFA